MHIEQVKCTMKSFSGGYYGQTEEGQCFVVSLPLLLLTNAQRSAARADKLYASRMAGAPAVAYKTVSNSACASI